MVSLRQWIAKDVDDFFLKPNWYEDVERYGVKMMRKACSNTLLIMGAMVKPL